MKLRITHNSIRIRIQKSELTALMQKEVIEDHVNFPGGNRLQFSLAKSPIEDVKVDLNGPHVLVQISSAIATAWAESDQVSIEKYISLENAETLHLLVEKDFPCADRPDEDKSETFWELAPDPVKNC